MKKITLVFLVIFLQIFNQSKAEEIYIESCKGEIKSWDKCKGSIKYLGNTKKGNFVKGKLEGVGRYQFADGEYYDADFKNDVPTKIIARGVTDFSLEKYDLSEAEEFYSSPKYKYKKHKEALQHLADQSFKNFTAFLENSSTKIHDNSRAYKDYKNLLAESKDKKISELQRNLIKSLAADYAYFVDNKHAFELRKEVAEFFTSHFPDGHPYNSFGLSSYVDFFTSVGPTEKLLESANKLIEPKRMVGLLAFEKTSNPDIKLCELQNLILSTALIFYDFQEQYDITSRGKSEKQKITFDCKGPKDSWDGLIAYADNEMLYGDKIQSLFLYKLAIENPYIYSDDCLMQGNKCEIYVHIMLALNYRKLSLSDDMRSEINHVRFLCETGTDTTCNLAKVTYKNIFYEESYSPKEEENRLITAISKAKDSAFGMDFYLSDLSSFYKANNQLEQAIFYKKLSLKYYYKFYIDTLNADKKAGRSFKGFYDQLYQQKLRGLAELFILMSRFDEAEHILSMIKESELVEYTRGDSLKISKLSLFKLNQFEDDFYTEMNKSNSDMTKLILKINERLDELKTKKNLRGHNVETSIPITQDNIVSKLSDAILFRYLTLKDKTYVIITTPQFQFSNTINISEKDLNAKIFLARHFLSSNNTKPSNELRDLYELLFKPLESFISPNKNLTIMLSLDKNLRYLPFAALYDGKHYLAEKYNMVLFLDSAKDKLTEAGFAESKGVAYGASQKIKNFQQLPFVKDEIFNLIKSENNKGLISGKVFLDQDFNLKSLDEIQNNQHPIVHFSSHFVFSPGSEENSFLLLGDGTELSLKEIRKRNLNFKKTNLVTLSACDTAKGGGKDDSGKEIDGFSDLILEQGADSVLASLWKVADKSTSELINKFYKNYLALGMSKAESLRKAQSDFISEKGKFNHPFYWSPFIIIGNYH